MRTGACFQTRQFSDQTICAFSASTFASSSPMVMALTGGEERMKKAPGRLVTREAR
jgi:hypothetical protein